MLDESPPNEEDIPTWDVTKIAGWHGDGATWRRHHDSCARERSAPVLPSSHCMRVAG
jgi:hypothetical protein